MKTITLFTLIGAVTVMLMLSACHEQSDQRQELDSYDYPIKPGTEEWKAFGMHDQMVKACQIPEDTLKKMSTEGLAETVLHYPLLSDVSAFNSVQYGFERVSSQFNGLSELLNREDAGSELSATYRTMDPAAVSGSWTDVEKGAYLFKAQHIETILAQERVLQRLSSVQRNDLLGDCIAKYEGKQRFFEVYGKAESTVWLMGRILQQAAYAPFTRTILEDPALQSFLNTGSFSSGAVRNEILSQAGRYLAES
jgi:hypothetical protein